MKTKHGLFFSGAVLLSAAIFSFSLAGCDNGATDDEPSVPQPRTASFKVVVKNTGTGTINTMSLSYTYSPSDGSSDHEYVKGTARSRDSITSIAAGATSGELGPFEVKSNTSKYFDQFSIDISFGFKNAGDNEGIGSYSYRSKDAPPSVIKLKLNTSGNDTSMELDE